MIINLEDELAGDYLAESREHLTEVETDLLAMETGAAAGDGDLVNRVFRAVHSIKGGAGFFDLPKLSEVAHATENALALLRSGKMTPTPERVRVLLHAIDKLRELVDHPAASSTADVSAVLGELAGMNASGAAIQPRPSGRLRVLLVEDDFACRLLLQTFLSRYGECHIAVNGLEAVDAFRVALEHGQLYDLVCMDIMMPVMDGREAVRNLRAIEESHGIFSTSGAAIIMTTAVDDVREVILCFKELCDGYLMKPIDLALLVAHMRACHLIE